MLRSGNNIIEVKYKVAYTLWKNGKLFSDVEIVKE